MPFEPYIIPLGVRDIKFHVGSQQGADWYDPLKPYTLLEYEWVLDNVDLKDKFVLDCGAHHGNYSVVLGQGAHLVCCVEPFYHNAKLIEKNAELNGLSFAIYNGAVANKRGMRAFDYRSNGRLVDNAETEVECKPMWELLPEAQVIKVDIEGGEYEVFPKCIDKMENCKTWIIEAHPQYGHPVMIVDPLQKAGFEVLKVNREEMIVEPYDRYKAWYTHATVIARKA